MIRADPVTARTCASCGLSWPVSAFAWRVRARGLLGSYCALCRARRRRGDPSGPSDPGPLADLAPEARAILGTLALEAAADPADLARTLSAQAGRCAWSGHPLALAGHPLAPFAPALVPSGALVARALLELSRPELTPAAAGQTLAHLARLLPGLLPEAD